MATVRVLEGGQELEIRTAAPEDAERVLVYIEQVSGESNFLTFGPGEFEMTVEQESDFFRACHESPNRLYFLGFIDDELVATANVMASPRLRLRHRGELGMSVVRAFWGLGIGAAMLDHLVAWAQENPMLTKLDLRVRADNTRAIALYRRRGFVEEGVLRKQFCIEGEFYDLIAMGMEV
jgi:RimJ/RimL family protein N-acetyltransferase